MLPLKIQAADRRARLGALKEERLQLEKKIRDLEALVQKKDEEIAPFSPVYTLSDDVVSIILELAYKHHFPHCRLDDGRPHTNSPIPISHVSRWWRRQALSLPCLWSCIHVTSAQPPFHHAEAVRAYIERSSQLPLSISFLCIARDYENATEDMPYLDDTEFFGPIWTMYARSWRYLLAEKYRWKNCAMYFFHEDAARAILPSLNGRTFPRLEYLGIAISSSSPFDTGISDIVPKFDAPSLTELRATSWLSMCAAPSKLFSRLTELKLCGIECSVDQLMSALAKTTGTLERFTLTDAGIIRTNRTNFPSLTFSKLSYLLLDDVVDYDIHGAPIPNRITCPLLYRAAVVLKTLAADPKAVRDLCQINVHLPTVKQLHLLKGDRETIPVALFRTLPNIKLLSTHRSCDLSPLLQAAMEIDRSSGSCISWPHLQSLLLWTLEHIFVTFAQHRAQFGQPLKSCILRRDQVRHVPPDVLEIFRQVALDFSSYDDVSPEIQALYDHTNAWWDDEVDKPIYTPWKGSYTFFDEFDRPRDRPIPRDSWLENANLVGDAEPWFEPGHELDD